MADNSGKAPSIKNVTFESEFMETEGLTSAFQVPVNEETIAQLRHQLGSAPELLTPEQIDEFIQANPSWNDVMDELLGNLTPTAEVEHSGISTDLGGMSMDTEEATDPIITTKRQRTTTSSAPTKQYDPFKDGLFHFSTDDEMLAAAHGLDSIAGNGQGWVDAANWMKARTSSKHKEAHAFVCVMAAFTPLQLLLTGKRKNVSVAQPWDPRLVAHLPMHDDISLYAGMGYRSGNELWKRINAQMCFRVGFLCMHHKWGAVSLCESWEAKMGSKLSEITDSNAVVKAMPEATRNIFLEKVRDFRAFGMKVRLS